MGDLLAVTCESCREPMVPNVSTMDEHGCGWICLNPECPELAAVELEADDLVEAGVPRALARRLTRLLLSYADAADEPCHSSERARAALASLGTMLREAERLNAEAAAVADSLRESLRVSFVSDEFAVGEQAKADLAVASALARQASRMTSAAVASIGDIDPDLSGVLPGDDV
jgi:hypothetical protein